MHLGHAAFGNDRFERVGTAGYTEPSVGLLIGSSEISPIVRSPTSDLRCSQARNCATFAGSSRRGASLSSREPVKMRRARSAAR